MVLVLLQVSRFSCVSRSAVAIALLLGASVARAQTAEEVAAANNPLARINAINLHNFFIPSIYGAPNVTVNAFLFQPVYARPRMVFLVTLPLSTVSGPGVSESGIGDLNIRERGQRAASHRKRPCLQAVPGRPDWRRVVPAVDGDLEL